MPIQIERTTDRQIMQKAIQRAIEGGWKFRDGFGRTLGLILTTDPNTIIFNHDFAKALWGDEQAINGIPVLALGKMMAKIADANGTRLSHSDVKTLLGIKSEPRYCYFLQQIVIADDPIEYLGENI